MKNSLKLKAFLLIIAGVCLVDLKVTGQTSRLEQFPADIQQMIIFYLDLASSGSAEKAIENIKKQWPIDIISTSIIDKVAQEIMPKFGISAIKVATLFDTPEAKKWFDLYITRKIPGVELKEAQAVRQTFKEDSIASILYGEAAIPNNKLIKQLLVAGVDPNIRGPNGSSALFAAIGGGANNPEQIMQILLAAGANVNHQNDTGIIPLGIAIRSGNPNTVKFLLGAGAHPSLSKEDLFQLAQKVGNPEIIALLGAYKK